MLKQGSWKRRLLIVLGKPKSRKSCSPKDVLGKQQPPSQRQPRYASTISLLDLPNELLLIIAETLGEPKYVYRLAQTNQRLASLSTPLLHKLALEDYNGVPSLHWAAEKGHAGLIRLLLRMGVDANIEDPKHRGWTALHLAARGPEPIVRLLLESKANVEARDRFDKTALHWALEGYEHDSNNEDTVRLLLEYGADIDAQDYMGYTVIHKAVRRRDYTKISLLQLLLDFHADISLRSLQGETVLHEVVKFGNAPSLKLLLENSGARSIINEVDNNGRTALSLAVPASIWIFQLILKNGPDLDIQDNSGCTPLHIAASISSRDRVRILVEKGANITLTNNDGHTARGVVEAIQQTKGIEDCQYEYLRTAFNINSPFHNTS